MIWIKSPSRWGRTWARVEHVVGIRGQSDWNSKSRRVVVLLLSCAPGKSNNRALYICFTLEFMIMSLIPVSNPAAVSCLLGIGR
jgi:hypothetical protein